VQALDLSTLFIVSILVVALLGTLLVLTWLRDRDVPALGWWGGAILLGVPAFMLFTLRGVLPDRWSIDVANAALLSVMAVAWGATRCFEGRRIAPALLAVPLAPWGLAAALLPGFDHAASLRVILFSAIMAFYSLAIARELRIGHDETLRSRRLTMGVLTVHAGWFAARAILCASGVVPGDALARSHLGLALSTVEGLLFTVLAAFLALSLAKEREDGRNRSAARTDPLTGADTRRAFGEAIAAMARRPDAATTPTALLLFDLDSFKAVNDTWGHQLGDRVLRLFVERARTHLRASDVFSRIGGEEFAAVLTGLGRAEAMAVAERIRTDFAAAGAAVGGRRVAATVSVGLASRDHQPTRFDEMFEEADHALYLAKATGRNRVRLAYGADATANGPPPAPAADRPLSAVA
jgi:diguanylate cyclase (GGDEF)-like protein